ncbi:hypothetical protein NCU03585 [Neurospora crassa OR74A]|uniref:Uncharacterized protein n=1 Tax=Neurospora crassa (strain ATCC 24698 / 74-OR23-1A / CBS 708.71 / DSM 1257 / FGSC 987) TaxID=367110 RepID=Q7S735_NEUCR|nr:hypothetical protein NCU03585 [Neurospora crassa OR74A]EAA31351.1 hypothetical protein NCU03585 [Neurospora crassa OR74A]|eukprot:XP_960587.1 hypothetical protein NCU03585 [Neurospora crassa OR74A]
MYLPPHSERNPTQFDSPFERIEQSDEPCTRRIGVFTSQKPCHLLESGLWKQLRPPGAKHSNSSSSELS